jgi:hypothetical protein
MLWVMHRSIVVAVLLAVAAPASAQMPSGSTTPVSPAARPSTAPAGGVPTYWVLMVTGEKDGVPWMKTYTPETLGGAVKGTGAWACAYPPTERGSDADFGYEQNEVACGVGESEVFMSLRCSFRTKAKPGKVAGKAWKRSELQTLNLRRKGDIKSTVTVSLRCDIDAAFEP